MEFDIRIGSIKTRLHLSQSENQIKKFPTLDNNKIRNFIHKLQSVEIECNNPFKIYVDDHFDDNIRKGNLSKKGGRGVGCQQGLKRHICSHKKFF